MSSRLATLVAHDARLQYRYGIYAAYAFVVAFYCAVLVWAGRWLPEWATAVIIFTDPAALGFFFLGALMMLEKSERVRTALAVAPISASQYFLSKLITLTGMSLIACAVLLAVLHRPADPALLLVSVALTCMQYVGIGVPIALRFRTVNGYLVGSAGFLAPLIAPGFLALLDDMPGWLAIVPAVSQLRLMLVATGAAEATMGEVALMLALSGLAAAGAGWLAVHFLRREFGR
jgi:fluoroquinolone transport system permease protein